MTGKKREIFWKLNLAGKKFGGGKINLFDNVT
jgi:hypothetical protein